MSDKQMEELNITLIRVVPQFDECGGGLVTDVKELSRRIDPFIKRQILIAPFDPTIPSSFDNGFDFEIIRVKSPCSKYRMPLASRFLNDFFYYFAVYRIIKTDISEADIIQAHGVNSIAYSCVLGKVLNIPVIGMIHGTREAYSKMAGFEERILATLFKPVRGIIIDSGTRASEIFGRIWGNRIDVVFHGIDTETYCPKKRSEALIQKLGFTESDIIILSISSLSPIKNINLAIEAFEKAIEGTNNQRIFLLIAGDGTQKATLMDIVKKKGLINRIKFLGPISNAQIPEYISISDICIGMSLKDNMNRSILEPMACGKPVIAFGGGNIEHLINNGYNGLLAKRGDVIDFTEKLKLLLKDSDLRKKMGYNAHITIVETRSWDTRIEQDLMVCRKAINAGVRRRRKDRLEC